MWKFLLILSLILVLISCEVAPVYLSVENERQIVVDCVFKPNDSFLMYLGQTHFTNELQLDTPAALSDADVRLFENGKLIGQFVESDTLLPWGGGVSYRPAAYTLDYHPVEGKTYRVEIAKEGYESVWAESYIPPVRGNLETIEISKTNIYDPEDPFLM